MGALLDEWKKKKRDKTEGSGSLLEEWRTGKKYGSVDTSGVNDAYFESYNQAANSFFSNKELREDSYEQWQNLVQQADTIRAWAWQNRDKLGSNYDKIMSATDLSKAGQYWNQFKTAEDYAKEYGSYASYNEMMNADLGALEQEIADWEGRISDLEASTKIGYYAGQGRGIGEILEAMSYGKDQLSSAEQQLAAKRAYYNEAKNMQAGKAYDEQARLDPEFANVSANGAVVAPDGRRIENWVAYYRDPKNYGKTASFKTGHYMDNDQIDSLESIAGRQMTDDEFATYNYLLGKGDKKAAAAYLKSLEYQLNQREASSIAANLKGRPIAEVAWAIPTGLDQFGSGINSAISSIAGNDGYITPSSIQMSSGMVREDLSDYGFKVFGSSVGQIAYDTLNTTANMAPSILAATAVNMVAPGASTYVGAGLMGLSAGGNAYAEALNNGYSKDNARAYGLFVGASEAALQSVLGGISSMAGAGNISEEVLIGKANAINNALLRVAAKYGIKIGSETVEEELQNFLEPLFRTIFLGDEYDLPTIEELVQTALVTALSTGALESGGIISSEVETSKANKYYRNTYGQAQSELVAEGLELDPQSRYFQRLEQKLASGKNLTGYELREAVEQNDQAVRKSDIEAIENAAAQRLAVLGETDFIKAKATALAKKIAGETLSANDKLVLKTSKYAERVAWELSPETIKSGSSFSDWARDIGTNKVNAEAYNKRLQEEVSEDAQNAPKISSESLKRIGVQTVTERENAPAAKQTTERAEASPADVQKQLESASEKYGAQAKAMVANYLDGQDVDEYDAAFRRIFDMGASSVQFSFVESEKSYLTDSQKKIAYEAGKASQDAKATAREQEVAKQATGGTKRKKGVVRGQGVSLEELSAKFNDTQRQAYKILSTIAEITGIDIVLYKSKADLQGNYKGAQGMYKKDSDPGTLYIDINAGLNNIKSAGDLANYTMLRTFTHEFVHFIENYNPVWYNELRRAVFDHIENADELISREAAESGLDYERASREVVAEALTDILPDSSFLEDLANNHKNIFEKLYAKFKEFVTNIKKHFASLSPNTNKATQTLKEGGKYVESVLEAFNKAALGAVENYQATVSEQRAEVEETAKISKEKPKKAKKPKKIASIEADFSNAMESVVNDDANPVPSEEIITDGITVTDGNGTQYSRRSMKADIAEGQMFEDLKTYCGWTQEKVDGLKKQLEDLVAYMAPYSDILDMNETYGREGRRYSPYKPNSDPLYTISMDFSTLCSKRLLTQYVIENLQLRENRPMSAEEQMAIRDMLKEYRKVEKGLQVACVMCYVEAARLKSPKQIQKWLDDPATAMRNYFADKNPEFSAYIKKAQEDFKESKGYDRNATKKEMSPKDVSALNKIRPKVRAEYQPSAEEMAIIETAKSLPNGTYLTAGNLADLSEKHPEIYKAYTAFIRTATRSKSLETDEPYYYGDSRRDNGNGIIVSDSFIEAVNRENGMRFSSWSDWRIQHMLDFITAVIDLSVRGAAMHGYTKFADEVRVLGKTGMMFNLSGVAGTQTGLNEDGTLNFSDTESINIDEAIALREEFPETAGLQCIGVSKEHILALLRSDIIDYVIPYHTSGLNATLRRMGDIYGWMDFTSTQHALEDKSIKKESAIDQENWHTEPVFSEFFVGYDTGLDGVEAMRQSADNYIRMCRERGLIPKFNEFANEPGYWKLLIDRKMVNQKTNTLIQQKPVTPEFDFDVIKGIVDKYAKGYDSGLENRALDYIVRNWDSVPARIRDLKKQGSAKAKTTKKAIDQLANETLAAQPTDVQYSRRGESDATIAENFAAYITGIVQKGNGWRQRDVTDYIDEHQELDFIERIFAKDKDVKSDLEKFLSDVDNLKTLDTLSWYMSNAYTYKTGSDGRSYRGAITTFKNAIKKRTNEIMTAKVNGTNIGAKNGEVTIEEVKDIFYRLNSNEEIGKFAEKVFATAETLGVNLRFVNQTFAKGVAGDNVGDMVEYKTSYFNDTAIPDQRKASTILHELIHACTVYVMHYNTTSGDVRYGSTKTANYEKIANAATRLNRIYGEIKYDPAFKGQYGIKDAEEMVAELANEKFVGLLKEKNLWDRIVDWICELFGFSRGTSAYDNAMQCLDYILDNPEISEYKKWAEKQRRSARSEGYDVFGKTEKESGVQYSRRANTEQDQAYMDAVESGDMETAQKMVDEAAKEAGYTERLHHGTPRFGFTKIETAGLEEGVAWSPFFATDSLEVASTYSGSDNVKKVSEASTQDGADRERVLKDIHSDSIDFAEYCNRTLGIRGWVDYDYISTKVDDILEELEHSNDRSAARDEFYGFCDELFYSFVDNYYYGNYTEKEYSREAFVESQEYEQLEDDFYARVDDIISKFDLLAYDASMGIYDLYANTEGLYEIDAQGNSWNRIPFDSGSGSHLVNTRRLATYARDQGYNGVKITNVFDDGGRGKSHQIKPATVYIFFDPKSQIKSADPVTYDDDGNIIPLSERFDEAQEDIRYQRRANYAPGLTSGKPGEGMSYEVSVKDYTLKEVANMYHLGNLGAEYDALFDKVYAVCENMGIVFDVVPIIRNEQGNEVPGVNTGDRVSFNVRSFNNDNKSNDYKSKVILHEMLHAATMYALRKYADKRGGATVNMPKNIYDSCAEMERVFNAIKNNPLFKNEYGIKNGKEMIAELSNPDFVEKLKATYPSAWHGLLDQICKLFGINKSFTNYDKLKKAVDEILAHPDYKLAKEHFALVDQNATYLDESQYADADVQEQLTLEDTDASYMAAVEDGDTETLQRMVEKAARKAGFDSPKLYHGTNTFGFTSIDTKKSNDRVSFFATDSLETAGTYSGTNRVRELGEQSASSLGIYQFYANTEGMLELDADGSESNHVKLDGIEKKFNDFMMTRSWRTHATAKQIAKYAKQSGYSGVIIKNVIDTATPESRSAANTSTVYIFFDPQKQLASADTVTYDDDGNVVPLSERFSSESTDIRYQRRDGRMTDQEVLAYAVDMYESDPSSMALSDAEKNAFELFKQRLAKLDDLTAQRYEQGQIYRENTFQKGGDRSKAQEAHNRMEVLDGQIARASEKLLDVKEKTVLQGVLQKARKVVEQAETKRGDEKLKRWRERRQEAASIKKYRDRIIADRDELINWLNHPLNKDATKHINDNVKAAVIQFLLTIDTSSKQKLSGRGATKADEKHVKQARKLMEMLNGLDDEVRYSGDYDLPLNFNDRLQRHITAVEDLLESYDGDTVLNIMTVDELQDLSVLTANLKTALTTLNKFHTNAMFAHVSTAGDNTVRYLRKMGDSDGSIGENFLMWKNIRPAYVWERFGDGGISIEQALRRGQSKLAWNAKEIIDYAKATFTKEERKDWEEGTVTVSLSGDREIRVTVAALMSFYELSKRAQGRAHILSGGVTVSDVEIRENKKKRRIKGRYGKFTEADIDAMNAALTDHQKEVADKLQQFMEKRGGEWGNHVTLARFGEKAFGEKGYFPISVDKQSLSTNNDKNVKGADLYRLLNMGFTKELSSNTSQPVVLYSIFDVFSTHMADMAQYNAMALPVLDAIRWLNYKHFEFEGDERVEKSNLRAELRRVYGAPVSKGGDVLSGYAESFIAHILQAYNGTEAQGTPGDSLGMQMLHTYNRAQIAFNMRVVVQQPMAITRASMVIDPKYITQALNPKLIKQNVDDMLAHSGIAVWKDLGYYDINISRGLTQMIKQDSTFSEKVTEVGLKPAEFADKATWAVLWGACKLQLKAQGVTDYAEIEKLFDEVIYKTQVVDSVLTKSQYMRDKGFFARSTASFMSEPTTTASMLLGEFDAYRADIRRGLTARQAWDNHKKTIGKTVLVYSVSAILLSMVTAAADAWLDDDDYQNIAEKWNEAFWQNLLDEISPFNKLPLINNVWELGKVALDTFTNLDVYGNLPDAAWAQWADTLSKAWSITQELIEGESNYTWYAAIYKYLQVASGLSGLPISAGTREVVTFWNNSVGTFAPSLKIKDYELKPMTEIKYAVLDGYLTADEAADELMEQELVYDREEAELTAELWAFLKDHKEYSDVSVSAYAKYKENCEGIDFGYFYQAWKYYSQTDADRDKDGEPISGSKKRKVLDFIYQMRLTPAQKKQLIKCFYK